MAADVASTEAGAGRWASFVAFMKGVRAEMAKVTWPDVPQVRGATIQIIIFVLVLALAIFLLDAVLSGLLVKLIPSIFSGR